jgi:hypothetical protein
MAGQTDPQLMTEQTARGVEPPTATFVRGGYPLGKFPRSTSNGAGINVWWGLVKGQAERKAIAANVYGQQ